MQGQAADWYDRYITGKNWKTNNIFAIIANGNIGAMRVLALNALAANSLRLGSDAANYAVANGALLVSNTIWPGRELIGVDDMWRQAGGQPTNELPNFVNAAGNAIVRNAGSLAGNAGQPYVHTGIHPGQALHWLRTQYPTILE